MLFSKLYNQVFTNEESGTYSRLNVRTLIYLAIIILLGIKQLKGFEHYLDISFFDESEYIKKGVLLHKHIYNDWGPSYNLWYYLLNHITHDATKVFYLNYILLMISLPCLLFLLLVRFNIRQELALLFSLSLLMNGLLLSNFTYVSHFCTCIILLGFLISTYTKKNEIKAVVLFTSFYICMYARPEFLLTVISVFIIWLIILFKQKRITANPVYLATFSVIFGLYLIFGFLSFNAQGIDRSYFAFMQHFITNYIVWHRNTVALIDFKHLDIFHGATTMFQCMTHNPGMFFKHVGTNMLNYVLTLNLTIEKLMFPSSIFHFLGKIKHALYGFFIIYFCYLIIKKKGLLPIKNFFVNHSFTSLLLLATFIWSFFSIFFIFPEKHYIIIQISWWILIICLVINDKTKWLSKSYIFIPILIIIGVLMPGAKEVGFFDYSVADNHKQPNLKTIHYLIKNNTHKPVHLLTTETGFEAYLPDNYKEKFTPDKDIEPYIHGKDFDLYKFLNDYKINAVFMNEKMIKILGTDGGAQGDSLLLHPETAGFYKQEIDSSLKTYLLLQK